MLALILNLVLHGLVADQVKITPPVTLARKTLVSALDKCPKTLTYSADFSADDQTVRVVFDNDGKDGVKIAEIVFAYPNHKFATLVVDENSGVVDPQSVETAEFPSAPATDDGTPVPDGQAPLGYDVGCAAPRS
jgi:hypothetical protein